MEQAFPGGFKMNAESGVAHRAATRAWNGGAQAIKPAATMSVNTRTGLRSATVLGALAIFGGLGAETKAVEASDVLLFTWEPLTIKPQFDLRQVYNDNFASSSTNPQKDFITTITPGVDLLLGKRSGNHLLLAYGLSQHVYADRTDLNSVEHTLNLSTTIDQNRWSLTGTDDLRFLTSPIGTYDILPDTTVGDRPVTGLGQNIDRTTMSDRYRFTYRFTPEVSIYGEIGHSRQDYQRGAPLFDVTTVSGTGGGAYVLSPKLVVFADVYHGVSSSQRNTPGPDFSDLTFVGGALGVRGAFTPKILGSARLGYEAREFEDGTGTMNSPVAAVSLDYRYSPKRNFVLQYVRRQDVSIQFDQQSYTSDHVSLSLQQKIGPGGKWTARLGGYYTAYDYEASAFSRDRSYEVVSMNFNVAYQIQVWLSAALGFDRTSVQAQSAGVSSYDVNRVTLSLSVGY